jgi:hypothetical protein
LTTFGKAKTHKHLDSIGRNSEWRRGSESGESFTDNQRHILIFNSDSSLILKGCKHYFAEFVRNLFALPPRMAFTPSLKISLKVSLKVFGGREPTLARTGAVAACVGGIPWRNIFVVRAGLFDQELNYVV